MLGGCTSTPAMYCGRSLTSRDVAHKNHHTSIAHSTSWGDQFSIWIRKGCSSIQQHGTWWALRTHHLKSRTFKTEDLFWALDAKKKKNNPPICLAFNLPYHLLPLSQQQYRDLQVQKLSGNNCRKPSYIIIFSTISLRFHTVYLQNGLRKHPLHTYSSLCHNTRQF